MSSIGHRITQLRKEKGWSQTELAGQAGASREAIGKYERGEASPSVETAKNIADAFWGYPGLPGGRERCGWLR